jgi:cell wall-associated NlpC family hydrolase
MSALALYLAKPLDEFSTLTSVERRGLAAVLRRGDVLLSAGNTRCAELVKRLTQSTWSHVSMYVGPMEDDADPLCVVEADIVHGVRMIRLSELNAHSTCVLRPIGLDAIERARLAQSVLRHVGSEYDLAHAWQLARSLMLRRLWARLRSLPTTMRLSATRFICSSLIAQAFAVVGYSILPGDPLVVERGRYHSWLVPADFERASIFAVVWPANARAESS